MCDIFCVGAKSASTSTAHQGHLGRTQLLPWVCEPNRLYHAPALLPARVRNISLSFSTSLSGFRGEVGLPCGALQAKVSKVKADPGFQLLPPQADPRHRFLRAALLFRALIVRAENHLAWRPRPHGSLQSRSPAGISQLSSSPV